jgi:hypothetical protein
MPAPSPPGESAEGTQESNMLRWAVDLATVVSAGVLIGGLYYVSAERTKERHQTEQVAGEVTRFQNELSVRAASGLASEVNPRGWPTTIEPEWFNGAPPLNTIVSGDRPWVEVAPPEHAKLVNPPMRVAGDGSQASFWYNPYLGIVRARVPMQINEARAIDLYNSINGTGIASLYEPPPAPEPYRFCGPVIPEGWVWPDGTIAGDDPGKAAPQRITSQTGQDQPAPTEP